MTENLGFPELMLSGKGHFPGAFGKDRRGETWLGVEDAQRELPTDEEVCEPLR